MADHVVTRYAKDVTSGKVVAGRLVRLACARHLRDLKDGAKRGLRFDPELASHAIDFYPAFLRLAEGEHAGKPFTLEPWQAFVIGSLFGWRGADGHRRFRLAYIETGKGNGKSPMLAGIGLYGMLCDDEPGAEIYAAAVTREQARIMFSDAVKMAQAAPDLNSRLDIGAHNIAHIASNSFFRPVSSEGRSLDGKRVHMCLIDEVHEHPDSIVVDKMRAGTKGRRQALIVEITNSGYNRHSVCWNHHAYSQQILEQTLDNDAWFAYVCQLDVCDTHRTEGKSSPVDGCERCDDWRDERVWLKANPNLGVSVTPKYLREQVQEAVGMPSKANIVRRLNFCIWTEGVTRWIAADDWTACAQDITLEQMRGRRCIAGLDLSSTSDLTALALVFPADEGRLEVATHFFVPADNCAARSSRDGVPYVEWARAGHLTATEGNVVDYDAVVEYITRLVDAHGVEIGELAYDPWNATAIISTLTAAGITCVPIRQGFASLSAPSKALETRVKERTLAHDGNPVMAWCMANACVEEDPAGNIKPSKKKSTERIDGVVALVTALARTIVDDGGESTHYETYEPMIV